jgi:phospholipase/carboxylesterase
MPVTINSGFVMPAWYDISHPDLAAEEDEAGIRASQKIIVQLIEQERQRGIPASRIVLAGFSQGGAIALHTALRYAESLAGILALSTYLPLKNTLQAEAAAANRSCAIFMAHGRMDNVIPLSRGGESRDFLRDCGYAPEWHEYAMAHSVCDQEITDIGAWLRRVLSPES